jgi:putative spermidine/putrescine transport system permease protein
VSALLSRTPFGIALTCFCTLVLVYILAPLVVIVLTSLSDTGFIVFPPEGLTLRHFASVLRNPAYIDGFVTSIKLATVSTAIAVPMALTASYAIARMEFTGRGIIEGLFLSPLILPGLVSAVGLTIFMSNAHVPSGMTRLVLAHISVCVPVAMRVMIPAFQRLDGAVEEAAMNLGAGPVRTFVLVSIPVVRPGILAAAALSFVFSFDEVDRTVFLAGARNPPLTVVLYQEVQYKFQPTLSAVAACLVIGVMLVVVVMQIVRGRK